MRRPTSVGVRNPPATSSLHERGRARRAEAGVGRPPHREPGRRESTRFGVDARLCLQLQVCRQEFVGRAAAQARIRAATSPLRIDRQLLIAVRHLEPRLDLVGIHLLAADFEQQVVRTQCIEVLADQRFVVALHQIRPFEHVLHRIQPQIRRRVVHEAHRRRAFPGIGTRDWRLSACSLVTPLRHAVGADQRDVVEQRAGDVVDVFSAFFGEFDRYHHQRVVGIEARCARAQRLDPAARLQLRVQAAGAFVAEQIGHVLRPAFRGSTGRGSAPGSCTMTWRESLTV